MKTTVGIDLAAEPKGTAIAAVSWHDGAAVVETLLTGCGDDIVLHWMHHPSEAVGIDCPFGWPAKFVDLVSQHSARTLQVSPDLCAGWRREYVLRATDRWVHDNLGLVPLSVAADRIGHTAIRLAALIARLGDHVRSPLDGSGALAEVYPAAALKTWGLPHRGYKRGVNAAGRNALVDEIQAVAPWLELGEHESTVRASDDALDAVVCALISRAVTRGLTQPPEDVTLALIEGWIHVPTRPIEDLR